MVYFFNAKSLICGPLQFPNFSKPPPQWKTLIINFAFNFVKQFSPFTYHKHYTYVHHFSFTIFLLSMSLQNKIKQLMSLTLISVALEKNIQLLFKTILHHDALTLITPAVVPKGCTLFKLVYPDTKTNDKNLQK